MFICVFVSMGVGMLYMRGILPGVSVAGIDLGRLSQDDATALLQSQWATITLRDGDRSWKVERDALGVILDVAATVEKAHAQGRQEGDFLTALSGVEIDPVVTIDPEMMIAGLVAVAGQINLDPVNAAFVIENGHVWASDPVNGRWLDATATVAQYQSNPARLFRNGAIELVMSPVAPAISDVSPLVDLAVQTLANPLTIRAHDPMTGDIAEWLLMPQAWGDWLTALPDANTPSGLALAVKDAPVRDFLQTQATIFDETRYLDIDEAVATIQAAILAFNTRPTIRVYHHDRVHLVQSGESITSIAWDYGVPYPWLQQSNPGVDGLYAGQPLVIPSIDNFLDFPVVADKRIVVSISQQHLWAYENGALLWDWTISTGINDSPTWPGIYQIISHELNAYAANWDLYMPNFMGVYRPIPGSPFTNGFHGFPTRGGGQILWENSLGRRVTYGCILLSNTNAQLLYNWAEDGVVVEIQG